MELFSFLSSLLFSVFTPTHDHQTQSIPRKTDHDWAAIADSVQQATFQHFLSRDGQYIVQDNGGNQTFHYWWNAHVLDVLVDAHLRNKNQEAMMLTILGGIKNKNKDQYPNNYYDDMEWLALSSLRAYKATDNEEFLAVTETLWKDIKKGWNDHQGGGIAWRKTQLDYKKFSSQCTCGHTCSKAAPRTSKAGRSGMGKENIRMAKIRTHRSGYWPGLGRSE